METYDTYCLVPEGLLSSAGLEALFAFTEVHFHWRDTNIPVHCGSGAITLFHSKMGAEAPYIRFSHSTIPETSGGWLYKLEDGSAVVGLCGAASVSIQVFGNALLQVFPDGLCYTPGEAPPPETASDFVRLSTAQDHDGFQ